MGFSLKSLKPGWTSAKRANDEAKRVRKEIAARKAESLGELSPENIQRLVQMFMTNYGGLLAPAMMRAQGSVGANAATHGLAGAGLTRSLKAGIPGTFSQMALSQAMPDAMNLAQSRAGVISETPIPYMPKKSSFADLMSMVGSYYGVQSPEQQNTGNSGMRF